MSNGPLRRAPAEGSRACAHTDLRWPEAVPRPGYVARGLACVAEFGRRAVFPAEVVALVVTVADLDPAGAFGVDGVFGVAGDGHVPPGGVGVAACGDGLGHRYGRSDGVDDLTD